MHAEKARYHSVFPVERHGDTLLVTPRGDASGFGTKELQSELKTILGWLDEPGVSNVVIDLGQSNYFGSQIIGAVNSLILKARDAGGKSGVCELSDDMQVGLSVLKIDTLWNIYATRREALANVATETVGDKAAGIMRTRSGQFALGAIVLLAVVAVALWVNERNRPTSATISRDAYETFTEINGELKRNRDKGLSDAHWNLFSNRSTTKVEKLLAQLEGAENIDRKLKAELIQAGRDCLLKMLEHPKEPIDLLEEQFAAHMIEAGQLLHQ